MIKLIKNADIFSPAPLGKKDILILSDRIAHIADNIPEPTGLGEVHVVDATGSLVVPGFMDQHVHLIGGGGEGGPATRTPEIQLSQITTAGITTVVGCLGTDGSTRHMSSLLAKARALEAEGLTTFVYTGAYEIPTPTLTGSVRDDLILIDKVIGVGELAMSDHRSSQPTLDDFKRISGEARVGGMLSGKPGLVHVHVGAGPRGIDWLFDIIESTEIPITQFTPTHMNRSAHLLEQSARFARLGGVVDLTAGIHATSGILHLHKELDVAFDNITISSDGNGSLPRFDASGKLVGLGVGAVRTTFDTWRGVVTEGKVAIEEALKMVTTNVARNLGLPDRKGCIKVGADADILILTKGLDIRQVWAKGRLMVDNGRPVVLGTFEAREQE